MDRLLYSYFYQVNLIHMIRFKKRIATIIFLLLSFLAFSQKIT